MSSRKKQKDLRGNSNAILEVLQTNSQSDDSQGITTMDHERDELRKSSPRRSQVSSNNSDTSSPERVFQCKHCDMDFNSKDILINHIVSKHSTKEQKIKEVKCYF